MYAAMDAETEAVDDGPVTVKPVLSIVRDPA